MGLAREGKAATPKPQKIVRLFAGTVLILAVLGWCLPRASAELPALVAVLTGAPSQPGPALPAAAPAVQPAGGLQFASEPPGFPSVLPAGGLQPQPPTVPVGQPAPVPMGQPVPVPMGQPVVPTLPAQPDPTRPGSGGIPAVPTEGSPSYGNLPSSNKGHLPPLGVRLVPPQPPPLPGFPGGFGMGRFAESPQAPESETELQRAIRENMTVSLRGAGLLRIYGAFRGDADFATSRFNDLVNKLWVLPNDTRFTTGTAGLPNKPDDFNYALYPRNSRLGFEYYGEPIPAFFDIRPGGRMTFDFFSQQVVEQESRQLARLRVGYVTLQKGDFTFLAGQDWDVISPLLPTINDGTAQWNAGNTGDRRAQLKLLWDHKLDSGTRLQVQQALVLLNAVTSDIDGDGLRDNEAWGLPGYEARLGVVVPGPVPSQPLMAGIWGGAGREETTKAFGGKYRFPRWIAGVDARVPLNSMFAIQTEFWTGSNLDDFRGGIGQGINTKTGQLIRATGGFAELVFRPLSWYQGSVGFTGDFVARADIPTGGREQNYCWYIGSRFPVGGGLLFGIDYQNWYTQWKGFNQGAASLVKVFTQMNF